MHGMEEIEEKIIMLGKRQELPLLFWLADKAATICSELPSPPAPETSGRSLYSQTHSSLQPQLHTQRGQVKWNNTN